MGAMKAFGSALNGCRQHYKLPRGRAVNISPDHQSAAINDFNDSNNWGPRFIAFCTRHVQHVTHGIYALIFNLPWVCADYHQRPHKNISHKYAHGFICFVLLGLYWCNGAFINGIFTHVIQGYITATGAIIRLPQGQSYDCPSGSDVTLKDMGEIENYLCSTKY